MNKFNRFIRILSAALIIFTLIAALAPTSALAKGKPNKPGKVRTTAAATTSSINLIVPANQETCTPSDTIRTTGVPDGATVKYIFYVLENGTMKPFANGTVTGNLNVPFPYPKITGTMTFGVSIVVFDGATLVFKAQKKWSVTCNEVPPPPPPPPSEDGAGCTPGYWRQTQHYDSWVSFSPTDDFEFVFGVDASFNSHTLGYAVWLGGAGEFALARHAVAALLNASNPDVSYAYSVGQVIAMVQSAYATGSFEATKNLFEAQNETFCPLN